MRSICYLLLACGSLFLLPLEGNAPIAGCCPKCPPGPPGPDAAPVTNVFGYFTTTLPQLTTLGLTTIPRHSPIPLVTTVAANQTSLIGGNAIVQQTGTYLITYTINPEMFSVPIGGNPYYIYSLHLVSSGTQIIGSPIYFDYFRAPVDLRGTPNFNLPIYGQALVHINAGDGVQLFFENDAQTLDLTFNTSSNVAPVVSLSITRISL